MNIEIDLILFVISAIIVLQWVLWRDEWHWWNHYLAMLEIFLIALIMKIWYISFTKKMKIWYIFNRTIGILCFFFPREYVFFKTILHENMYFVKQFFIFIEKYLYYGRRISCKVRENNQLCYRFIVKFTYNLPITWRGMLATHVLTHIQTHSRWMVKIHMDLSNHVDPI